MRARLLVAALVASAALGVGPATALAPASRTAHPVVAKARFKAPAGRGEVINVQMAHNGRRRVLKRRRGLHRRAKASVVTRPGPDGTPLLTGRTTLMKAPRTRP